MKNGDKVYIVAGLDAFIFESRVEHVTRYPNREVIQIAFFRETLYRDKGSNEWVPLMIKSKLSAAFDSRKEAEEYIEKINIRKVIGASRGVLNRELTEENMKALSLAELRDIQVRICKIISQIQEKNKPMNEEG